MTRIVLILNLSPPEQKTVSPLALQELFCSNPPQQLNRIVLKENYFMFKTNQLYFVNVQVSQFNNYSLKSR